MPMFTGAAVQTILWCIQGVREKGDLSAVMDQEVRRDVKKSQGDALKALLGPSGYLYKSTGYD